MLLGELICMLCLLGMSYEAASPVPCSSSSVFPINGAQSGASYELSDCAVAGVQIALSSATDTSIFVANALYPVTVAASGSVLRNVAIIVSASSIVSLQVVGVQVVANVSLTFTRCILSSDASTASLGLSLLSIQQASNVSNAALAITSSSVAISRSLLKIATSAYSAANCTNTSLRISSSNISSDQLLDASLLLDVQLYAQMNLLRGLSLVVSDGSLVQLGQGQLGHIDGPFEGSVVQSLAIILADSSVTSTSSVNYLVNVGCDAVTTLVVDGLSFAVRNATALYEQSLLGVCGLTFTDSTLSVVESVFGLVNGSTITEPYFSLVCHFRFRDYFTNSTIAVNSSIIMQKSFVYIAWSDAGSRVASDSDNVGLVTNSTVIATNVVGSRYPTSEQTLSSSSGLTDGIFFVAFFASADDVTILVRNSTFVYNQTIVFDDAANVSNVLCDLATSRFRGGAYLVSLHPTRQLTNVEFYGSQIESTLTSAVVTTSPPDRTEMSKCNISRIFMRLVNSVVNMSDVFNIYAVRSITDVNVSLVNLTFNGELLLSLTRSVDFSRLLLLVDRSSLNSTKGRFCQVRRFLASVDGLVIVFSRSSFVFTASGFDAGLLVSYGITIAMLSINSTAQISIVGCTFLFAPSTSALMTLIFLSDVTFAGSNSSVEVAVVDTTFRATCFYAFSAGLTLVNAFFVETPPSRLDPTIALRVDRTTVSLGYQGGSVLLLAAVAILSSSRVVANIQLTRSSLDFSTPPSVPSSTALIAVVAVGLESSTISVSQCNVTSTGAAYTALSSRWADLSAVAQVLVNFEILRRDPMLRDSHIGSNCSVWISGTFSRKATAIALLQPLVSLTNVSGTHITIGSPTTVTGFSTMFNANSPLQANEPSNKLDILGCDVIVLEGMPLRRYSQLSPRSMHHLISTRQLRGGTCSLTSTASHSLTPNESSATMTAGLSSSASMALPVPLPPGPSVAATSSARQLIAASAVGLVTLAPVALLDPLGGGSVQRSLLLAAAAYCVAGGDPLARPPPAWSPTQMCFGSLTDSASCSRGGIVGNLLLMLAFAAAAVCASWIAGHKSGEGLVKGAARLQLPGWLVAPFSFLLQPTVGFSMNLIAHPTGRADAMLGLVGLACLMPLSALPILCVTRYRRYFQARLQRQSGGNSILDALVTNRYVYSDSSRLRGDGPRLLRIGHAARVFRNLLPNRRWFVAVEAGGSWLLGLSCGIVATNSPGGCKALAVFICVVTCITFAATVFFRPYGPHMVTARRLKGLVGSFVAAIMIAAGADPAAAVAVSTADLYISALMTIAVLVMGVLTKQLSVILGIGQIFQRSSRRQTANDSDEESSSVTLEQMMNLSPQDAALRALVLCACLKGPGLEARRVGLL